MAWISKKDKDDAEDDLASFAVDMKGDLKEDDPEKPLPLITPSVFDNQFDNFSFNTKRKYKERNRNGISKLDDFVEPEMNFKYKDSARLQKLTMVHWKPDDTQKCDYIGDDVKKLFSFGEKGPLFRIFCYSTPKEMISSFSFVNKDFYGASMYTLQHYERYTPAVLNDLFGLRYYVTEKLFLTICRNFELSIPVLDLEQNGNIFYSFLYFCVYHNFTEGVRFLVQEKCVQPINVNEVAIAANKFNNEILYMLLEACDPSVIRLTREVVRCFLYHRDLRGLKLVAEKFDPLRRDKLFPGFFITGRYFINRFFCHDDDPLSTQVLSFCGDNFFDLQISLFSYNFLRYCHFMGERALLYCISVGLDKENPSPKLPANDCDYFIRGVDENKKLSTEQKKRIIDHLFKHETVFKSDVSKQGFEFVYFYGKYNEKNNFLSMFPKFRRFTLECFHCGTKVFVFKRYWNSDFVRCQDNTCCPTFQQMKQMEMKDLDERVMGKIFCRQCYRRRNDQQDRARLLCIHCNAAQD